MLSRQGCRPPGTTLSVGRGDGATKTGRILSSPCPLAALEKLMTEAVLGNDGGGSFPFPTPFLLFFFFFPPQVYSC